MKQIKPGKGLLNSFDNVSTYFYSPAVFNLVDLEKYLSALDLKDLRRRILTINRKHRWSQEIRDKAAKRKQEALAVQESYLLSKGEV